MISDLRTFTVKSGRFAEFIEAHKRIAFPIVSRHLGPPLGYWSSITGGMNQFIHIWQFEDMADFEKRQASLNSDPQWRAYLKNNLGETGILQKQESVLMRSIDLPELEDN